MTAMHRRTFLAAATTAAVCGIAAIWIRGRRLTVGGALPSWYDGSQVAINRYLVAKGFPTVKQLRQGILLGCIAEAVYIAENGGEREHFWEDDTYVEDIAQGERWAAAFVDGGVVATFYTNENERNAYPPDSPPYDQSRYFRGMPDHLAEAKKRALGWMIDFDYMVGGPNAAITAAMWADGERFTAAEPWAGVYRHSLWACSNQLLPQAAALAEWRDYFDLDDEQLAAVRSLYERKLAAPHAIVAVQPNELAVLRARSTSLATSREAFVALGIVLP